VLEKIPALLAQEVTTSVNIPIIGILNVATLLISVFVLIAPSYLVSHIQPVKAMQFD
jgi:lipoprotein-releasing system permease protein